MTHADPAQFWEDRYAGSPRVWSGRPNAVLVDVAGGLSPGRALDLGCGEGGDPVWLAQHGWQVTAVDISATALRRGAEAAAAAGVPAGRIDWVAHDLATWTDGRSYDLASAFFLQSPVELDRVAILRRAAARVAAGGHLLVVTHAAPPPWATQLDAHHHDFHTPAEEIQALDLDPAEWRPVLAETRHRLATGPDGRSGELDDTVVLLQRGPW